MRTHLPALRRPRYADVAATLALIVAMGGTAYGVATTAAPNSVNTAAIQNHAVTTPKLADEAVTSPNILSGSVTGGKLAPGSVTAAKVRAKSLAITDLVGGTTIAGQISINVRAEACATLRFSIIGAQPGSTATLSFIKKIPTSVVLGPLAVLSHKLALATACNMSARAVNLRNLKVRITTLA